MDVLASWDRDWGCVDGVERGEGEKEKKGKDDHMRCLYVDVGIMRQYSIPRFVPASKHFRTAQETHILTSPSHIPPHRPILPLHSFSLTASLIPTHGFSQHFRLAPVFTPAASDSYPTHQHMVLHNPQPTSPLPLQLSQYSPNQSRQHNALRPVPRSHRPARRPARCPRHSRPVIRPAGRKPR